MLPNGVGRRATSYHVAQAAGVSQPTVSRCFQPGSTISQATRERVLEAADRLGYTPNALARSLITQRSNLVAVIATRYTLRGNPDVTYAIGESLRAAGKQVMLVTVEHDLPDREVLRQTLEYPLDGLISCAQLADIQLEELRSRHIPVVLFNRTANRVAADHVTTNHALASEEVARLLCDAGHRRFLCLGGPAEAWVSHQRVKGFRRGLRKLKIGPPPLVETDFSYACGRDAFLAYVAAGDRPDAVFCANDQLALGVMDACRFQLGWRIPDDISVVGFDDVSEADRPCYRLTTMRQPSVKMAEEAVRLLLHRLDVPGGEPAHMLIGSVFVHRSSARLATCGKPAE